MSRCFNTVLLGCCLLAGAAAAGEGRLQLGRLATPEEVAGWDIDIRADGVGLPPGRGSVAEGEAVYEQQCAVCHGDFGEGAGRFPELIGGIGSLASEDPRKTVGSFWPYAPTLFDYIRRTMPFTAPQSLSADETYAVTAYVLHLNELLPADAELDAARLAAIEMPNRNGFILPDPRPDVAAEPCMSACKPAPVTITSDLARRLGVTPKQE